jgi:K+/H+ antiporter YhaU regulatory subunit KhtT
VPRRSLGELSVLADLKLERLVVEAGSEAEGRSAVALDLRRRTGALVVAVQRAGALREQPEPGEPFVADDIVFLAGSGEALRRALELFSTHVTAPVS